MKIDEMSRQRLDFSTGPNGETVATVTITLGDGSEHRYSASTDDEEIENLASALALAEIKERKIEGSYTEEEIAGLLDFVKKGIKVVSNVAKKVASSKAFALAATGLALAAPALGPFAGPALAVSAGMGVASKLAKGAVAAEAGAKRAARLFTKSAKKEAKRRSPKNWRKLLKYANRKRKALAKVASKKRKRRKKRKKKPSRKRRPTTRRRPTPRRRRPKKKKKPNIITAAKKGKLRSNKKGAVTRAELKRAAKRGRIFWIGEEEEAA